MRLRRYDRGGRTEPFRQFVDVAESKVRGMFLWPAGETVFDELTLVPGLAVADNFFIGQEIVIRRAKLTP